jgi:hypothetical protein
MGIGLRIVVTTFVVALTLFGFAVPVLVDARHGWPRRVRKKQE